MDGFNEWANRHCRIFGLHEEKSLATVAAWQEIFDACPGYTAERLQRATTALARHGRLHFLTEHLPAIHEEMKDIIYHDKSIAELAELRRLAAERGTRREELEAHERLRRIER